MNYLDIARSGMDAAKEAKEVSNSRVTRTRSRNTDCEKSELSEKSLMLCPLEAERLKVQIIEIVTVDPAHFDRAEYDRLFALWDAHEAAGGAP